MPYHGKKIVVGESHDLRATVDFRYVDDWEKLLKPSPAAPEHLLLKHRVCETHGKRDCFCDAPKAPEKEKP